MTAYVSTQSGNFNDPATWGGAGVPTAVDTFEVTGGITVTVPAGYSAFGIPTFTDTARNLATFGQAFLGTTTAAEAVDAFMSINGYDPATGSQTGPVLTVEPKDVVEWVKQGWTVSDASLINSGHDGQNIGMLDQRLFDPVEDQVTEVLGLITAAVTSAIRPIIQKVIS